MEVAPVSDLGVCWDLLDTSDNPNSHAPAATAAPLGTSSGGAAASSDIDDLLGGWATPAPPQVDPVHAVSNHVSDVIESTHAPVADLLGEDDGAGPTPPTAAAPSLIPEAVAAQTIEENGCMPPGYEEPPAKLDPASELAAAEERARAQRGVKKRRGGLQRQRMGRAGVPAAAAPTATAGPVPSIVQTNQLQGGGEKIRRRSKEGRSRRHPQMTLSDGVRHGVAQIHKERQASPGKTRRQPLVLTLEGPAADSEAAAAALAQRKRAARAARRLRKGGGGGGEGEARPVLIDGRVNGVIRAAAPHVQRFIAGWF